MAFDVDGPTDLDDVSVQQIAREEVFRAAINTQNAWRENLRQHGFVNTGEAVNDVTVEPQREGADEYVVGGDVIQLAIAEFGRRPGARMPPHEPIADWVHEQQGLPNRGDVQLLDFGEGPVEVTFDQTVFLIRRGIAENGIEAFQPGQRAFREEAPKAQDRVEERRRQEMEG